MAEANIYDLHEECFRKILLFAGDVSAFYLCGTCTTFRKREPKLEVLLIDPKRNHDFGYRECEWLTDFLHSESLSNAFCMVVFPAVDADYKSCYDFVERLPQRHAETLTHLYMRAIHGHTERCITPLMSRSDRAATILHRPVHTFGSNLTILKTLIVEHPQSGFGYIDFERRDSNDSNNDGVNSDDSFDNDEVLNYIGLDNMFGMFRRSSGPTVMLADCLVSLCHNTADTLKALRIIGPVWMEENTSLYTNKHLENAKSFLVGMNGLHYLELSLIPPPYPIKQRRYDNTHHGREGITEQMQKFVAERCPNLKHKASIICHINERPWEDSHSYDTTWGCDGDERTQQFLERHSCLAPDPRVVFSEYENNPYNHRLYTPYGYTGAWCGWIDKCVPQDRTDCAPCLAFRHSTACFANPDIVWEPTSYDRYYDFI